MRGDQHADRDDRERGTGTEARRREADRKAAPIRKPLDQHRNGNDVSKAEPDPADHSIA